MTKDEFQKTHGFDDQTMAILDHFREVFGAKKPCKVQDQKEGRWIEP